MSFSFITVEKNSFEKADIIMNFSSKDRWI